MKLRLFFAVWAFPLVFAPVAPVKGGQATSVFAQTSIMGQHASEQASPRLGLRNLARSLYAAGALPDDTMQSLGVFVAGTLGLTIDACTAE